MSASQTPHSALLNASHASSTSSSERLRKAVPNTASMDLRRLSLPGSIGPLQVRTQPLYLVKEPTTRDAA